jgi:hypothetical protein
MPVLKCMGGRPQILKLFLCKRNYFLLCFHQSPGKIMDEILFDAPEVFVPDPIHLGILNAVAEKQGCHINHVVHQLLPTHSESSVRSAVRILLSKRCLDGGKASNEIVLRLTSKGRLILQKAAPAL